MTGLLPLFLAFLDVPCEVYFNEKDLIQVRVKLHDDPLDVMSSQRVVARTNCADTGFAGQLNEKCHG